MGTTTGVPLVSVVVPAWNAEDTLWETLHSVSEQTHRNLEILIVDDGSVDGTAQLAAQFCAQEPRARLISKRNGGVASARNQAIVEAKGEWIAPIDADDLWHPTKIEKQVAAAIAALERPGFIYCWHRLIDKRSRVIGSGPCWAINGRVYNQLAYLNVVENGSALLISREALRQAGGYDESLRARRAQGCEDVMVQLEVARRHPVAVIPEYLVGHRRHQQNMSSDFDQMVRSWRLVYQRAKGETPSLPRRVIRWVDAKTSLDSAEQRAIAGHYGVTLRYLVEAVVRDPLRTGSILAYRIARATARRINSGHGRLDLLRFSEVDPSVSIPSDPHELTTMAIWMDWLNARRLRRLAELDRDYS